MVRVIGGDMSIDKNTTHNHPGLIVEYGAETVPGARLWGVIMTRKKAVHHPDGTVTYEYVKDVLASGVTPLPEAAND